MRIQPEYLLADFRAYMEAQLDSKNTADRYYYAVCRVFRENAIEDFSQVEPSLVLDALEDARGRNRASALKLGLSWLKKFHNALDLPKPEEVQDILSGKRDRSVLPAKTIFYEEVESKVMRLRNTKLKLAFLLMVVSGLRVSEVAALTREDITVTAEGITVNVLHGKGDKAGHVDCLRSAYLERHLPKYLLQLPDGEKPFYAAKTMKNKALALGLECHDFRRIAAIRFRKEQMQQRRKTVLDAPTVPEINEATKEFLRHERFSTTKRYLYNRKLHVKLPADRETEE